MNEILSTSVSTSIQDVDASFSSTAVESSTEVSFESPAESTHKSNHGNTNMDILHGLICRYIIHLGTMTIYRYPPETQAVQSIGVLAAPPLHESPKPDDQQEIDTSDQEDTDLTDLDT